MASRVSFSLSVIGPTGILVEKSSNQSDAIIGRTVVAT